MYIFGRNTTKVNAVILVYPIRTFIIKWHTIPICPISDDVYFGNFVKMMSARLLYVKLLFFLFVTGKYFVESYFETM